VRGGGSSLVRGEVRRPEGCDETPVPADGAPLDPGRPEIECFEVHPRYPESGEHVPAPAPDRRVAPEAVAEAAGRRGERGGGGDHEREPGRRVGAEEPASSAGPVHSHG
jgi:hypothetical protein